MSAKLRTLLIQAFTAPELDRFFSDHYPSLRAEVDFDKAPATVATAVVDLLTRQRLVDDVFFEHLKSARPMRSDDIEAVRRDWAETSAVSSHPVKAPPLAGQTTTNIYNAPVIMGDGASVGNKYENKGQVGAMGDGAVSRDNTFIQHVHASADEIKLNAQDAAAIEKLSEALALLKSQDLQQQERFTGAAQLAAIAAAAQSGQSIGEPLAAWEKWFVALGDRGPKVLAVLANTTTTATPIMRMLGLP